MLFCCPETDDGSNTDMGSPNKGSLDVFTPIYEIYN